ncbi:serine protease family protein [Nocardioides pacificus]
MTSLRSLPARRTARSVVGLAGAAALAAALVTAPPAAAAPKKSAAPTWAPADSAAIHPGVQMYTEGAQCTGNFVFTDGSGATYVGYAAHCAGLGEATDTNGCDAASLPLGTKVDFVEGGSLLGAGTTVGGGTLAYSSWNTMQERGESDADTCAYNDFALVKVDAADVSKVNPSVPFWGGPVAVSSGGSAAGDKVYSFGNSSLRGGIELLSPKVGLSLGATGNGWSHSVYTMTPGVPGDSGSGFLDAEGNALGTLSTLALAPLPASNGVGDLAHELAYAQQHSGIAGLALVPGTEAFSPIL